MSKASRRKKTVEDLEDRFLQALEADIMGEPAKAEPAAGEGSGQGSPVADSGTKFTVTVRPDNMAAILQRCPQTMVRAEELVAELNRLDIRHGIDRAAIMVAVEKMRAAGGLEREMVIAAGTPPEPAWDISYSFLEQMGTLGSDSCVWLVDGAPLFADIAGILAASSREELDRIRDVVVKAVAPGEVIVAARPRQNPREGKDIFGKPVAPPAIPLQFGENIAGDPATGEFRSKIYGYLHVEDCLLDVIAPLWFSPDQMEAFLVILPQVGSFVAPDYAEISSMLLHQHVKPRCIHSRLLEKVCESLRQRQQLPLTVRIAEGSKPQRGGDGKVIFHVDTTVRAGTLREDNSIDLRERNTVVAVAKGTTVAERIKATKGRAGMTLFGAEIEAADGVEAQLKIGKGIAVEEQADRFVYRADFDGNVTLKQGLLSLAKVINIAGDIDYASGNVTVKTDLAIGGSVKSGFTVRADGNVLISGMVEPGSTIEVTGNLTVQKGILGEETRVTVRGNLFAQFIQDAEVIAAGDVTVGSYVYNSTVRAGGVISVKRMSGSSGKVIGGVVIASRGIEVSTVGSATNRSTVVGLQPDAKNVAVLRRLDGQIRECTETILKMMRTLNLDSVDPLAVRARLDRIPEEKKAAFGRLLLNLSALIKQKNRFEQEKKELQEKIDNQLAKATVRVSKEFFQGNEVQIGSAKLVPPTDLGPSVFQLRDGRIVS
ncbi:MAG: FapA family protein [Thermodesulfobacteriota bacterium]